MKTTVVHVRKDEFDVYIGRAFQEFPCSKWHNPYSIGKDGTRSEVIGKYKLYVLINPDLMKALPELKGKRLGCWCSPKPCHGDVLVKLIEEPEMIFPT